MEIRAYVSHGSRGRSDASALSFDFSSRPRPLLKFEQLLARGRRAASELRALLTRCRRVESRAGIDFIANPNCGGGFARRSNGE